MMQVRSIVFPKIYRDSMYLMKLSSEAMAESGARQVSAMMATPRNKELLSRSGLLTETILAANADDLVVAIEASPEIVSKAEQSVRSLLDQPVPEPEGLGGSGPPTLEQAKKSALHSNLALISVPGDYARYEAAKALALDMNVLLYSDNISLQDEIKLKKLAASKGLILMGPGCGTAILEHVPLGFGNLVRPGITGIVSSSGTGIQEVSCLLDRCGLGISQALGTGARDMLDEVGGISTLTALDILARDRATELIILIAKRPGEKTRKLIAEKLKQIEKPVLLRYQGVGDSEIEASAGVRSAPNLTQLALMAVEQIAPTLDTSELFFPEGPASISVEPGYIRGIFSGGALCFEALEIAREQVAGDFFSNLEMDGVQALENLEVSRKHTFLDMGTDFFTVGRPHPIVSPSIKMDRILDELLNPDVAVVLTDIVLGFGVATDQAPLLVQTLDKAARMTSGRSRKTQVVVTVCGTERDDPGRSSQIKVLRQAGIIVLGNNVAAANYAADLIGGGD